MTYVLSFRSEVEEDAIGGYGWYEEKAMGLGDEFLRCFYTSAQEHGIRSYTTKFTRISDGHL